MALQTPVGLSIPSARFRGRFMANLRRASLKKSSSMVCCRLTEKPARETNGGGHMASLPNGTEHKGMNSFSAAVDHHEGIGIIGFLKGKQLLVTGATGFLGKVLIEKILRAAPDVGRIYVLIKAKNKEAAMERLKSEIVSSELFRCLQEIHGNSYQAFMLDKLVPVVGNVRELGLGIEAELADRISEEVDVIVNSAANTTFNERYDVALDINTIGPSRLMSFAKGFKKLKLLVHISTAYVNGQRQGRTLEKPFCIGDTIAREGLTSELLRKSVPELNVEGEIKLAFDSSKTCDDTSMIQEMKSLGLERAKMHGWQDTYVFTKAMGEMTINDMRDKIPVVTIRPSVIESTLREPFPGWIEGNRMMDPLVLSYGKGQLTGFPADPDGVLDVVPADMVVNATLAAMAKHGLNRKAGMHVYHVASSVINPLVVRVLVRLLYEHFSSYPCKDSKGSPISVPTIKLFHSMKEFWSDAVQKSVRAAAAADVSHDKLSKRHQSMSMKTIEHLASIYEPYTFYGGRFDNTNTQMLMAEMSQEEMRSFGFDVGGIDWKDYLSNVHIPGVRRHVMKERNMSAPSSHLVDTAV